MNPKNIPIFVINLKESKERGLAMQRVLGAVDLSPIFIDAVDGKLLGNGVKRVYEKKKSLDKFGRELSDSEIGCALSHIKIYKEMITNNIEVSLILEDDVSFNHGFLPILNKIKSFPDDWELVHLGHHGYISRSAETIASIWGRTVLTLGFQLARPAERVSGTYGYLINLGGAKKLLNLTMPLFKPIDCYTGNSSYLNVYVVTPAVVEVNDYLSDNYHTMSDREALSAIDGRTLGYSRFSWYKKLAINMGLYKFLAYILYKVKSPWQFLRPLKPYVKRKQG